jgi:ABC-2 type transport system permease protein
MDFVRRIIALMIKEFIMILKDPKSRFVIIGPPLIQFFMFGYAATYDLKNVRYAVLDESRTTESRQLLSRFEGSENFELTKTLLTEKEIAFMINREKVRLVIHIGPEFSRDLHNGRTATLQVIVDGRNSNVALIALGYIGSIVEQYNQDLVKSGVVKMNSPGVVLADRAWFNANLQSRWFIVSALGGLISMVVVTILTSLSLFAAGAVYWFGVPFRGTVPTLVLALGCFIITIVGVGLLVSSLSMTMQQALLGSFVFMMPSVILSGFATPIENMPHWLQIGTLFNPLRHIITALRNIFLEGAGVNMIWPQLWPLLLMACFTLPLAGWMFRHRSQ